MKIHKLEVAEWWNMIKVQEFVKTFSDEQMAEAPSTTISVGFQQPEKLSELWY